MESELTAAETRILRAMATGMYSTLLPSAVGMDEGVVDLALWSINRKLGTTSREAMLLEAERLGIVKMKRQEATPLSFEGVDLRPRCTHGVIGSCSACERTAEEWVAQVKAGQARHER